MNDFDTYRDCLMTMAKVALCDEGIDALRAWHDEKRIQCEMLEEPLRREAERAFEQLALLTGNAPALELEAIYALLIDACLELEADHA